jgi:hypothetical protein
MLLGFFLVAMAIPAWRYLAGLDVNVFSLNDWRFLLVACFASPQLFLKPLGMSILWAVASPIFGLLLFLWGAFSKTRSVETISVPKGAKKNRLTQAPRDEEEDEDDDEVEDEGRDLTDHEREEAEVAVAPGQVRGSSSRLSFFRKRVFAFVPFLIERFSFLRGKGRTASADAAKSVGQDVRMVEVRPGVPANESFSEKVMGWVPSGLVVAVERVSERFSKTQSRGVDLTGEDALDEVPVKSEKRSDSDDVERSVMEWHAAWNSSSRTERMQGLLSEAKRIQSMVTESVRASLANKHGMRGISAVNALEAAASRGGGSGGRQASQESASSYVPSSGRSPSISVGVSLSSMESEASSADADVRSSLPSVRAPSRGAFAGRGEAFSLDDDDEVELVSSVKESPSSAASSSRFVGLSMDDDSGVLGGGASAFSDEESENPFSDSPYRVDDDAFSSNSSVVDRVAGDGGFSDDSDILDVEDDIDSEPSDDAVNPEEIYFQDKGAQRILESVYQERFDAPASSPHSSQSDSDFDADSSDIRSPFDSESSSFDGEPEDVAFDDGIVSNDASPFVSLAKDEVSDSPRNTSAASDEGDEGDDDRSSMAMSNETMDSLIAGMGKVRLDAIIGERSGSPKWMAKKFEEAGLSGLSDKQPLVLSLWKILGDAVDYQAKAFAWSSSLSSPPPKYATMAQREEFIIGTASSIVALRSQLPPSLVAELCEIKAGSEEIAWLSGRAELIMKALSTSGNKERLKSIVNKRASDVGGEDAQRALLDRLSGNDVSALTIPLDDLLIVDPPYEEACEGYVPVFERYRVVGLDEEGGALVETYKSIQIAYKPEESSDTKYGVVDAIVGGLRVRISKGLGPMDAGAVGFVFVQVPRGEWIIREYGDSDGFSKDRFVLVGDGKSLGRGVRVRDKNMAIFAKWLEGRQLKAHSIIHFILDDGAVVRNLPATLGTSEVRICPWTKDEWKAVLETKILPRSE